MLIYYHTPRRLSSFSALQRAEIAEMDAYPMWVPEADVVSVLFNEPKLLKCDPGNST